MKFGVIFKKASLFKGLNPYVIIKITCSDLSLPYVLLALF
jgi:hypothetical protein